MYTKMSFIPYHRHFEDEEINARIILKFVLGKYITVVWIVLKRLDVGLLAIFVIRAVEIPGSAARVLNYQRPLKMHLVLYIWGR